jgi:hypothetical protein
MNLLSPHPDLQRLSAFAAGELPADERARTAAHMQSCAACQDQLRFIHRINEPAHSAPQPAGDALLERIQRSRAEGVRVILPAQDVVHRERRVGRWFTAAAGVLIVLGAVRVFAPTAASAAADHSTLVIAPKMPQAREPITVKYTPVSGTFRGESALQLRARVRTPDDESYTVPSSGLRVLGTLVRQRDGTFTGRVTLPDSVVFAMLAVEDSAAATVDDNVGRGWEVIVSARDGRPLFAALEQRSNDMMGRSWEQAYAAARRMTELYPDSISGWTLRQFFEGELFSGHKGDSVRRVRDVTIDRLVASAKERPQLGRNDIGSLYYRAYARANSRGGRKATQADSAEWQYWWTRIQREYPTHDQIAQRHAMWMDDRALGTARALDSLERLYVHFAPSQNSAGRNVVNRGVEVATALGDAALVRRWSERLYAGLPDSARRMAVLLSDRRETRTEGMRTLRTLLRDSSLNRMVVRPLGRNAAAQTRAVDDLRRTMLAALGRALLAEGQPSEALDTLRRAAEGSWDPSLFRELARSYAQAGDSVSALQMQARLLVDGRLSKSVADSLNRTGTQRLGSTQWEQSLAAARGEMHTRLLERSISRGVSTSARVASRDGASHALAALTGAKPALVIFWSRNCGYALDAVPRIQTVVTRLRAAGTPVVFVVDEAPSADMDAALAEKQITWPVYYDVQASLGDAMRNFGTPQYYVLDGAGRIRFAALEELGDVYGRLDAVASDRR